MFQNITQIVKNKFFYNSKQRKMALSCSKQTITLVKKNNI